MIKSPCKDCKKHKESFPGCLDECTLIQSAQEMMFFGGSKHKESMAGNVIEADTEMLSWGMVRGKSKGAT